MAVAHANDAWVCTDGMSRCGGRGSAAGGARQHRSRQVAHGTLCCSISLCQLLQPSRLGAGRRPPWLQWFPPPLHTHSHTPTTPPPPTHNTLLLRTSNWAPSQLYIVPSCRMILEHHALGLARYCFQTAMAYLICTVLTTHDAQPYSGAIELEVLHLMVACCSVDQAQSSWQVIT